MECIEETGNSKEEAIAKALDKIGLNQDEVEVEILEESKKRFGFFGSNLARVKIHYDEKLYLLKEAKNALKTILDKMGLESRVIGHEKNNIIYLNIGSPQGALIIGRRGQTIDALQYLINHIVNKSTKKKLKVILDTENYRNKRQIKIEKLAYKLASQVKATGTSLSVPPMNSHDRRIVHLALQNDHEIKTISKGEGQFRKVKIILRNNHDKYLDEPSD